MPTPFAVYDFHEAGGSTASDIMGNGPVLTAATPATAWSGPNAATEFDANPFNLPVPWSICVNAYMPVEPQGGGFYIYYVTASGVNTYCYGAGGNNTVSFYSAGTNAIDGAANSLKVGEQQLVWTCDGTTLKMYAGGALVGSGPGSQAWTFIQLAVTGAWPAGTLIRDVTFWKVTLSAAEVLALSAPPGTPVSAPLAGAGSLNALAAPRFSSPSPLAGAGSLDVSVLQRFSASVDFAADGNLVAGESENPSLVPDFAGMGALTLDIEQNCYLTPRFGGLGALRATAIDPNAKVPYYPNPPDTGRITHEWTPPHPVEGIDYVNDWVHQADGTVRMMTIRRLRP